MDSPTQRQPKLVFSFHHLCCLDPGARLFYPGTHPEVCQRTTSFLSSQNVFLWTFTFHYSQSLLLDQKVSLVLACQRFEALFTDTQTHRQAMSLTQMRLEISALGASVSPWALLCPGDLRTDHSHPTLSASAQNMAICRTWWLQLGKIPQISPFPRWMAWRLSPALYWAKATIL